MIDAVGSDASPDSTVLVTETQPLERDPFDPPARPDAWIPAALIALVAAAFLIRFSAAEHLTSHVDEAASVLAARMVAERGIPLFPSGTLYLQGATISYLLAPVVGAGWGDYGHLLPLRLLSVLAGTASVLVMFLLGRELTRSAAAGFVAAVILALDPSSVMWSGMVRMYALLQLLALLVIWLFMRSLLRPPSRRVLVAMVALFWAGIFTHVGIGLLLPAMGLAAMLIFGYGLLSYRRDLTLAIGACGLAPVVFLALNRLVTAPGVSAAQSLPGVSFVGDFLFSADQILHPSLRSWTLLFGNGGIGVVLPTVVLAASCLLLGRHFLGESPVNQFAIERRRTITALLLLYWLPIAAVATLATVQSERYLLHIHAFGFMLVVVLVFDLVAHPFPVMRTRPGGWHRLPPHGSPSLAGAWPLPARIGERPLAPAWFRTRAATIAAIAGVTLAGAALRLDQLDQLSLWFGEGLTVLYSRQPWAAVAGLRGFYSQHAPLYFVVVKISDLVLPAESAGRIVSALAGIATIPAFALLMARLLDRRAAIVATAMLAISPIHIYYSQEASMHSLQLFLVTVSYLAFISYLQRPRMWWIAIYGIAAALSLWVDFTSAFVLAPQAAYLGVQLLRHRHKIWPLLFASVGALAAFIPWMPQLAGSIAAVDVADRPESYLTLEPAGLFTALLSVIGFGGDDAFMQTMQATLWKQWPLLRPILLIALIPLVIAGARGLWRGREAKLIAGGLLIALSISIWASLMTPGIGDRTLLTSVLLWAALCGAAVSVRTSALMRLITVASLAVVILAQMSTIDVLRTAAVKEQWRAASDDFQMVSLLGFPLVTYSYAGAADTMLDIYNPALLDGQRVVTIRDGKIDDSLTNGVIPAPGLSRVFDLPAGRLSELLPQVPENRMLWYLSARRDDELDVQAAIRRAGYTLIMHKSYVTPRSEIWLNLYARPDADLGPAQPVDQGFAGGDGGWVLPGSGATAGPGPDGAVELRITNQKVAGHEAFALTPAPGTPAIVTFNVEFLNAPPNAGVVVTVSCLSATGVELAATPGQIASGPRSTADWRSMRATTLCPTETSSIRLSLMVLGRGEVRFRNPTVQLLLIG